MKHIRLLSHKEQPSISTMIINKSKKISIVAMRNNVKGSPYITMNKIKNRSRQTRRIRENKSALLSKRENTTRTSIIRGLEMKNFSEVIEFGS